MATLDERLEALRLSSTRNGPIQAQRFEMCAAMNIASAVLESLSGLVDTEAPDAIRLPDVLAHALEQHTRATGAALDTIEILDQRVLELERAIRGAATAVAIEASEAST